MGIYNTKDVCGKETAKIDFPVDFPWDGMATYPACNPPLAQRQLQQAEDFPVMKRKSSQPDWGFLNPQQVNKEFAACNFFIMHPGKLSKILT